MIFNNNLSKNNVLKSNLIKILKEHIPKNNNELSIGLKNDDSPYNRKKESFKNLSNKIQETSLILNKSKINFSIKKSLSISPPDIRKKKFEFEVTEFKIDLKSKILLIFKNLK